MREPWWTAALCFAWLLTIGALAFFIGAVVESCIDEGNGQFVFRTFTCEGASVAGFVPYYRRGWFWASLGAVIALSWVPALWLYRRRAA